MRKSFLSTLIDLVIYPHGRDEVIDPPVMERAAPTLNDYKHALTMPRQGKSFYGRLPEVTRVPNEDNEKSDTKINGLDYHSCIVDDYTKSDTRFALEALSKANKEVFKLRQANTECITDTVISQLVAGLESKREKVINDTLKKFLADNQAKVADYDIVTSAFNDGDMAYYAQSKKTSKLVRLVTFKAPYLSHHFENDFKSTASYEVNYK